MPWLTILGLLPIIGGLIVMTLPPKVSVSLGPVVAVMTLGVGVMVFFLSPGINFSERFLWIQSIGAWYALDIDGMAKLLILLTVLLVPLVMFAEYRFVFNDDEDDEEDRKQRWSGSVFFGHILLLEGFALYCFMASDVLLFYIFFEATLIPMYFLIGGWGKRGRSPAALKFLLFNLAGGLVMLFGVIAVRGLADGSGIASFLISDLKGAEITTLWGRVVFIAFFVAFAVKAPMVPVHTWLPTAAEYARPGASVLMVGILDKIGTFGMIRLCLGLFPEASVWASPVVIVVAVISVLYGALMAIGSADLLRLVAYTSVSHFGFIVLGIFSFTTPSISGAILYMVAHGFSSAALFFVVAFLISRGGTPDVHAYGGVRTIAPVLAGFFLIAGLSTLALPGFVSFVGEYLVMAGSWLRNPVHTAVATLGTVLAAVYVMLAYQRTMTGQPPAEVKTKVTNDLDVREKTVLTPLVVLMLLFGFVPNLLLGLSDPVAKQTMQDASVKDPAPIVKGVK